MQKGQKAPVGAIEKHKKALHANFLSSLDFESFEEYADTNLVLQNNNKISVGLTLRQYYMMVKSGKSAKDIKNSGFDKHLLYFYNCLMQHKINLSEEQFSIDYLDGRSLDEISKKYNIERGCLTYLREMYGIRRKGAKFIQRKQTEESISDQQRELIYGTLMGDGKKMSMSSLGIKHSSKSEDYVLWKYAILKNLVSPNSLKKYKLYDPRYEKWNESVTFYTKANTDIETILTQFYGTGKKIISSRIMENLTLFSIAIWYMDDGTTDWQYRNRKFGQNIGPTATICTDSFTILECIMIIDWFKSNFKVSPYLTMSIKNHPRVAFDTENTAKLFEMITPYVIASMQYKVKYDYYLEYRKSRNPDEIIYPHRLAKSCPVGDDFKNLTPQEKDTWIDLFIRKIRKYNFPCPTVTAEMKTKFIKRLVSLDTSKFCNSTDIFYHGYPSAFIQSFHPHLYTMKSKGSLSACEIVNDDAMLKDIIQRILLNNNLPNRNNARRFVNGYRGNKMISMFPCYGAKTIYDMYCTKDSKVIDFCAGFGSRMLGAFASQNVATYLACEPNVKTFGGLQDIINDIRKIEPGNNTELQITNSTAEDFLINIKDDVADLIFTSPQYFNTEIYENKNTQSCYKYNNYSDWLENWLFFCINESIRLLKIGGNFVLNVANCYPYMIADDVEKFLHNKQIPGKKMNLFISNTKCEPLFVFQKC